MKRIEPKSLSTIIDEALKASNMDVTAREHRAAYLWSEVMGPGVNRYTSRRYAENGTLHVYITSGPLKNELSFNRERIVRAINNAVGSETIHTLVIH